MDIDINGRGIAQINDSEPPTCECCGDEYTMETGHEPTPFCDRCAHDVLEKQTAELATLRTTLARLTADLAAVTAERDMWRGECASISAELDLPPGMRPMEGELRRMLGHNRALLAQVTTLTAERDEALNELATARAVAGRAAQAAQATGADLVHIGALCGMTDDEYPLKAVQRVVKERDEARGLLGEAHHVLDQMHDEDDTIGRLKVDVPADGHPRQWLFDYVTQYGHGLRARIAAHLGRSE